MIRYNVKVNDQIYQVDLERDTTIHDAESTESSADICFEAIKAEYDYCVTRAEKLENKVYILLAACAFVFIQRVQVHKNLMLQIMPQSVPADHLLCLRIKMTVDKYQWLIKME